MRDMMILLLLLLLPLLLLLSAYMNCKQSSIGLPRSMANHLPRAVARSAQAPIEAGMSSPQIPACMQRQLPPRRIQPAIYRSQLRIYRDCAQSSIGLTQLVAIYVRS